MSENEAKAPIKVTSWHGGSFAMVPQAVVKEWTPYITATGLAVYTVLCSYADNATGHSFPKQKTIADLLGISVSTVSDLIADMAELGLLTIKPVKDSQGRFEHNEYYLCQPSSPAIPLEQAPRFRREATRKAKKARQTVSIPSTAEIDKLLGGQVTTRSQASNQQKPGILQAEARLLVVSDKLDSLRELDSRELDSRGTAPAVPPSAPPVKPSLPAPDLRTVKPTTPKSKRTETPEETAYYAACVPVVARACRIDLKVTGEWARCKKPLQALYHATVRPTPELLSQHYETPTGYWYTQDFRGKKGETPEPHWIQNTWGKATGNAPPVNGPPGGKAKPQRILGPSMLDLRRQREAAAEAERRRRYGIPDDDSGHDGHVRGAVAL